MADWLAFGVCWRIPELLNRCARVVAQKVADCAPRSPRIIFKSHRQNGCFDLGNKVSSTKLRIIKKVVLHPAPPRPIPEYRAGNWLAIHPARHTGREIGDRHADNVHARPGPFIIQKMHCTRHGSHHAIARKGVGASRHAERLSAEGLAYADHFMSRRNSLQAMECCGEILHGPIPETDLGHCLAGTPRSCDTTIIIDKNRACTFGNQVLGEGCIKALRYGCC
ncbi:hypothetical protein FQZ97_857670 [compost metagenome]